MKKKLLVVLLCVVMFCAGCVVTGLIWRSDTAELYAANDKLAAHVDTMEDMLQDRADKILELSSEVTELKMDMLKLEAYYGIDVEELLGE